jgi:Kef-type K+ transport system membrane component KefB
MAFKLRTPITRTIGRLLTLVVVSLLTALFSYLGPMPGMAKDTMLLGFLLLSAFVAGELARELRLPRITGYLVIGILFGPHVLSLLPQQTVSGFRLINDTALSVIALQAGGELRLHSLKQRVGSFATIGAFQIILVAIGITAIVLLSHEAFPFLAGQPHRVVLAVAMIFGLVAVAKSPATTIAVITELKARGPLADTVLAVSVLKDVAILLMIAAVIPAAAVLVDPTGGFDFVQLRDISLTIVLALLMGVAVGWLIVLYLHKVNVQPILFVLAAAFIIVELTHALHLESEAYILSSMAAGFVVQNFSVQGPKFVEALEANSLPIYALFFAVAGADLRLGVIPSVWQVGLVLIIGRLVLIYLSTYLGAVASGEGYTIRKYSWMGFIAQAGVTLGLANIVQDRFPVWGEGVATIVIAMIAVNQLIGPPLFRFSLVRAKEAG